MDLGVKMTVARLGTSLVMELMRVLEGVRGRLSAEGGGGGQSQGTVLFCSHLFILFIFCVFFLFIQLSLICAHFCFDDNNKFVNSTHDELNISFWFRYFLFLYFYE